MRRAFPHSVLPHSVVPQAVSSATIAPCCCHRCCLLPSPLLAAPQPLFKELLVSFKELRLDDCMTYSHIRTHHGVWQSMPDAAQACLQGIMQHPMHIHTVPWPRMCSRPCLRACGCVQSHGHETTWRNRTAPRDILTAWALQPFTDDTAAMAQCPRMSPKNHGL